MLSVTPGTDPTPDRASRRRSGAPLAVSLAVNGVVLALFFRAATLGVDWSDMWRPDRSAEVRPERIGFVQLPPPRRRSPAATVETAARVRPPRAAGPRPPVVAPTTVPSALPPGDAPAGEATGGSGDIVGGGGATEGIRPSYADPRLWTRPGAVATAPRTAKERVDSVIADRLTPVRDSMLAAQALADGQRKPGDWTMNGPGGTWGMDQKNIHLGKVKIPNAVLALLSGNLQKNLRGNPTELANDRRLSDIRADLLQHANREMSEDEFKQAVKAIRQRKDRERAARRAVARAQGEGAETPPRRPPEASGGRRLLGDGGLEGVAVEERAEDPAHHAQHGEVVARPDRDLALGGVRRHQHRLAVAVGERLHRRLLAQAGRDDVALAGRRARRDHHEVTLDDPAAGHAVALHPQRNASSPGTKRRSKVM
jgi:hypothetical protein